MAIFLYNLVDDKRDELADCPSRCHCEGHHSCLRFMQVEARNESTYVFEQSTVKVEKLVMKGRRV